MIVEDPTQPIRNVAHITESADVSPAERIEQHFRLFYNEVRYQVAVPEAMNFARANQIYDEYLREFGEEGA